MKPHKKIDKQHSRLIEKKPKNIKKDQKLGLEYSMMLMQLLLHRLKLKIKILLPREKKFKLKKNESERKMFCFFFINLENLF